MKTPTVAVDNRRYKPRREYHINKASTKRRHRQPLFVLRFGMLREVLQENNRSPRVNVNQISHYYATDHAKRTMRMHIPSCAIQ